MITRSQKGISLFRKKDPSHLDFPVKSREVKDVTGAGDTVLAMITIALASKLSIEESIELANIAAGIAIEHLGCTCVYLSEVAQYLLKDKVDNKILNENDLFAVQKALEGKKLTLLRIDKKQGLSTTFFTHIKKLSKESQDEKFMIYLVGIAPDEDFISFLSSIDAIDFIITDSPNLPSLVEQINPSQAYTLNNDGTLSRLPYPKTVLI